MGVQSDKHREVAELRGNGASELIEAELPERAIIREIEMEKGDLTIESITL